MTPWITVLAPLRGTRSSRANAFLQKVEYGHPMRVSRLVLETIKKGPVMVNLTNLEKISIKSHPEINEKMIQDYLAEHPEVLGLGRLELRQKEQIFPNAGRLDLLFSDEYGESRYEVGVQLGATDPSHIIRTIEYWDNERKRQPQYEHCAVIVAEDITSRFLNVISLFNGNIPLIAIQLSAYKTEGGVLLTFTKILGKITFDEEENDDGLEIRDRSYWEHRSTPTILGIVDSIFNDLSEYVNGCELKYNKYYIGIQKEGISRNFISFTPKKTFLYINTKGDEDQELINTLENAGVEVKYEESKYRIRINRLEDYQNNKDLIKKLVAMSMQRFGIEENQ